MSNKYIHYTQKKENNTQISIEAPTLFFSENWYKGEKGKSSITKITFMDSYVPKTYSETWEANIPKSEPITCYIVNDAELIIAGNGSGKIIANTDSSSMFIDFVNVSSIKGLEMLDTSNVITMKKCFLIVKNLRN